jgi:phosphoribosylformylglycinamidine (FGAM) synthase PurS component
VAAGIPNSRRNLDIAIERLFGAEEDPVRVRILMANTIIGQVLPDGTVKGGSSLKLRYGNSTTRFTRDLDTVRAGELESFISELGIALVAGWNGFTGKVVRKSPAKPKNVPTEYVMQPFEIKLSYNAKSWLTVQLEVGHDEIGDASTPDYYLSPDVVSIFEQLGFPAPKPVPLMSISHQIAQKLHGLSEEGSIRTNDLVDLQLIMRNETVDYAEVRNICERLFAYRSMQDWPPSIEKGFDWDSLYTTQLDGLDVIQTVDGAIVWVNNLISAILDAQISNDSEE